MVVEGLHAQSNLAGTVPRIQGTPRTNVTSLLRTLSTSLLLCHTLAIILSCNPEWRGRIPKQVLHGASAERLIEVCLRLECWAQPSRITAGLSYWCLGISMGNHRDEKAASAIFTWILTLLVYALSFAAVTILCDAPHCMAGFRTQIREEVFC